MEPREAGNKFRELANWQIAAMAVMVEKQQEWNIDDIEQFGNILDQAMDNDLHARLHEERVAHVLRAYQGNEKEAWES